MTVPGARSNETDGNVGITPPTSGLPMVVTGICSDGATATPQIFTRDVDIVAEHAGGPAVQKALYALEWYGRPVIVLRTEEATAGSYGALDDADFAGTSVATVDVLTFPSDDFEVYVIFPTGGTIGVAGIKYQTSLDGGRTLSPVTALGTANNLTIPNSGGINIDFAAGTVVSGDILRFAAVAPAWDDTTLDEALLALRQSSLDWEFFDIAGNFTAAAAAVADGHLATLASSGQHHFGMASFRVPNAGETPAQYRTAFDTAFGAYASNGGHLIVTAGDARVGSSFPGFPAQFRRPFGWGVGARLSSVSEEIEIADIDLGPLPAYSIKDASGNPTDGHDEYIFPGLDDLRACVGRSWPGRIGVFVNKSTLLSPTGSDFQIAPHRRVMNLARTVLDFHMPTILFKPRRVNRKTGFLAETELRAIEKQINQILREALTTKPKAEFVELTLSRSDPVLKPPYPLTGRLRVISLAYVMDITIDVGFFNPANAVAA